MKSAQKQLSKYYSTSGYVCVQIILKKQKQAQSSCPQSHILQLDLLMFHFNERTMTEAKKNKKLGFIPKTSKTSEKKEVIKEPKGRLISWSPWPPANFKTRYPAFPLVTTVLILIILRWLTLVN